MTSLSFGTVVVGQSESQLITVTNTGQTTVKISAITVSQSNFSWSGVKVPASLPAGQSVNLSVTFTPTAKGGAGGNFTLTSNASNSTLQLTLGGAGATSDPVTAKPSSPSFGKVALGSNATLSVVLTNARASNETLTAIQGVGAGFSVKGPTLPLTMCPGQSVTLSVTFAPQKVGLAGGVIYISGPSLSIPLTGAGTTAASGQLTITPSTLNFGSVFIDTADTQNASLTATGGTVTVSSVGSSSSRFVLSGAIVPAHDRCRPERAIQRRIHSDELRKRLWHPFILQQCDQLDSFPVCGGHREGTRNQPVVERQHFAGIGLQHLSSYWVERLLWQNQFHDRSQHVVPRRYGRTRPVLRICHDCGDVQRGGKRVFKSG